MMPTNNEFFVDILCLAAYSHSDETRNLLQSVYEIYTDAKKKDPESLDDGVEVYFEIVQDILENDVDLRNKSESSSVILKIKNSFKGQRAPDLISNIQEVLQNSEGISTRRITKLSQKIRQWVVMSKVNATMRQMWGKCQKYTTTDMVTNDLILNEVLDKARELTKVQEQLSGTSVAVDMVDMTNRDSISRAVSIYRTNRKANVFKTGLKGLNKMLGKAGGFIRGEFWAFAAASHNYKSGILMAAGRWCATLSNFKVTPGMTPAVVLISLENEVPENTMNIIREAYVDAYKQEPPKEMTDEEMVDIVVAYYSRNGCKLLIYKFDEDFGYTEFVQVQAKLKSANYEVIATVIDYLTLMRIEDTSKDNPAKQLQKLAHKLYNFGHRNNQLIITGLQLDTEADRIIASGQTNIVKRFGAAHLGDCKGLKRELDGLIFMHIERNAEEVPYLTFCWNKQRNTPAPPKSDQYCAYRYRGEVLGIMDDIHLPGNRTYAKTDIFSDNGTDDADEELVETTNLTNPFDNH